MSATAVPTQPPPRAGAATIALSLPARLATGLSGTVGLVLKLAFLAALNALALWAATILATDEKWIALLVLAASTLALDLLYLVSWRRAVPLRFIVPGTVFLLAFQAFPILYTFDIAFSNYSTGHILTKDQAIAGIKASSLGPPPDGKSYLMAPARDEDGALVLVLVDEVSGKPFIGTREGLEPVPADSVQVSDDGLIQSARGYALVKGQALLALDRQLQTYTVPTQGDAAVRPEGLEVALELRPTVRYDQRTDTFVRTEDGTVFRDNDHGSFVSAKGEELEPGWKTRIGRENFSRVIHDPLIRAPFVRVFAWTFVFALLTVLLSFAVGLFLAITLDKPGMRFLRGYRAMLILPYAVPGFLSILVWAGLLNDDFGVINKLLHTDIPWLFDADWAKVSVLLVSVWLTFPYFFLVSLGALQSIPAELVEAARVDGAGPLQVFRRITLPLLLVAVAPLLIASFAFNFNNFNIIYLLTGGGPPAEDQSIAGGTDILISYTYKLAFEAGKGQDYGLASAIAIFIFFIVATISGISFWRSRTLEEVR